MISHPTAQPKNDERFLEEAIDLLLFLEQEVPKYIKNSDPNTAQALMAAAYSLQSAAAAVELSAIAKVAASLGDIFQHLYCSQTKADDTTIPLLVEGLECLQMLLTAFLMGAQPETEILDRMETIVSRFQEVLANRRDSLAQQLLTTVAPSPQKQQQYKGLPTLPPVTPEFAPLTPYTNDEHLEQLNGLMANLLINHNQQAFQKENQQYTIRQLHRHSKQLQFLLDNLQGWSERLIAVSDTLSSRASSCSRQVQSTLQSALTEVAQLSSALHSLDASQGQIEQQLAQQEKLVNYSCAFLKTVKVNPGQYEALSLNIPLGQTIKQLFICQADSRVYAFLADSVEQILLPQTAQIRHTQAGRMLALQTPDSSSHFSGYPFEHTTANSFVLIRKLSDVLPYRTSLPHITAPDKLDRLNTPEYNRPLLMLRYQDKRCVLEIDRIIGKQSSMIRPLGRVFSVADYIVGTSLLADNQLTLVLDGCRLTELLETLT